MLNDRLLYLLADAQCSVRTPPERVNACARRRIRKFETVVPEKTYPTFFVMVSVVAQNILLNLTSLLNTILGICGPSGVAQKPTSALNCARRRMEENRSIYEYFVIRFQRHFACTLTEEANSTASAFCSLMLPAAVVKTSRRHHIVHQSVRQSMCAGRCQCCSKHKRRLAAITA